ncbi:excalibur calcium-binding domain-containing protein [Brevundimonas sp.]|uniref:excalibur calcium-binding domain-containing protein n=1 Tax=Brevundimonas sp. TaxID=1871086 RepID=UPI00391850D0
MRFLAIAASAATLAMPTMTAAHPGGLNSEGCHTNRKTGDYHCHRGSQSRSAPARPQSFSSNGSGSRSGGAFANCAAARAAGAAPVRRGEPGYGRHLDRDGDGVGCER